MSEVDHEPRNIVLCFDGTNNEFGPENTNVVRLVQSLGRDESRQLIYYDPGVGTLPEPGAFSWLQKKLSEILGLAFGAGLGWKVQEAYKYLMANWRPGDRVYLFGFSRGAYTARVLAGFLHAIGLLPRGNVNLVPYAFRLYAASRSRRSKPEYWKLVDGFRHTFARETASPDDRRRFPIHFVGVWDTVSTVGWIWNPKTFVFTTISNTSVESFRHAVSIDERRCFFRQNLFNPPINGNGEVPPIPPGRDVVEHWFSGVHSDVGGGYPDPDNPDGGPKVPCGLWRLPFTWIVEAARSQDLLVDETRYHKVLSPDESPARAELDPKHESLVGLWWLAEFFPKVAFNRRLKLNLPRFGLGRSRSIPKGALIDIAALKRLTAPGLNPPYNPPNITPQFRSRAKDIPPGATAKAYEPR